MRNLLESDDFGLIAMTESINTAPVPPNRIGSLGLFREEGVTTTAVGMELIGGELRLIPSAPRGTMPQTANQPARSLKAISIPHLPKNDTVVADSLQGVRAFGQDSVDGQVEALATVINQRMTNLKIEHELTWEWHRIGALKGQVLDADGSTVLTDLFTFFGVARITVNWTKSDAQGLKKACMSLIKQTGVEIKNRPFTKVHVMCGAQFWEDIVTSTECRTAFERQQENSFARNQAYQAFEYSGVVFEPLHGQIGAVPFAPTNEGFSFPIGAQIFRRYNAPAPFNETVNTVGKPLYAKQEPIKFDMGTEIHTNSNPLHICQFPRTLIRVTMSA